MNLLREAPGTRPYDPGGAFGRASAGAPHLSCADLAVTGLPGATACAPPPAPSRVFALMDRGDALATLDNYAAREAVDGLALRTSWDVLEPQDGQYDWSAVDAGFDVVRARKKKLTLHVLGSLGMAPAWLAAAGVATYTYATPARAVVDPLPWDATYLSRYARFVAALGAHILNRGDAPLLEAVSDAVPVPEMSLVGCRNGILGGATAYDRASYLLAWKTTADALLTAFANVPLYVSAPVGVICTPDNDGKAFYGELMNYLLERSSRGTVFAADLNAQGSARMQQVDASISGRTGIAFQTIWSASGDPQNRMQGSLGDALCRGVGYGARYFEIYKADLDSADAAIQDAIRRVRSTPSC